MWKCKALFHWQSLPPWMLLHSFLNKAFPLQEFHSKSKFRMKIFINKNVSNLNENLCTLTTSQCWQHSRVFSCTRTRTLECILHSHSHSGVGVRVQIALQECKLHSRVQIALQSAKLHSRVLSFTPECKLHSRVLIALQSAN